MIKIKGILRRLKRRLRPHRPESAVFNQALTKLGPGKVAVDCGANIGLYTELLAATGATVHAFEPNPFAFRELKVRMKKFPNVHIYNKAVSRRQGSAELFFHKNSHEDPVHYSQSSSLIAEKSNIDLKQRITVETVDFGAFVQSLGRIHVMKMDIEGSEVEVLNDLLDRGLSDSIEIALVELHDRKNPSLAASTDKLRARMRGEGLRFDLTWH